MKKQIPQYILDEMKKYPPFYVKVWQACFEIPAGTTMTYGELAKKAGSPKAARAVMRSNPWPPVIPCHRVIASDRKMCGYSAEGGIEQKERLLKYEKETGKDAAEKVVSTTVNERRK